VQNEAKRISSAILFVTANRRVLFRSPGRTRRRGGMTSSLGQQSRRVLFGGGHKRGFVGPRRFTREREGWLDEMPRAMMRPSQ
jgi:hypothetical protein